MPEPQAITQEISQYTPEIINISKGLLKCALILAIGWLASKWAMKGALRLLEGRHVDRALARFLSQMAYYLVLAAALVAALGTVGIQTTSVVALLGSAGIAIGLALQGNLSHFASGVMILFFRPFTLGDVITVGGHTGEVQDIGLFATTLYTPDGQKIIIPNAAITGGSIVNITTRGQRRVDVNVGVAYGSDLQVVQAVLLKAAAAPALALQEPAPSIAFVGLGASSLDFTVMTWGKSEDFLALRHQLRSAIYDALNEAGIEIPFSQVVVHQASAD